MSPYPRLASSLRLSSRLILWLLATRMIDTGTAAGVVMGNLDDDSSRWGLHLAPPTHRACGGSTNVAVPSVDGSALRLSIDPCTGASNYTGLHFYRNLEFADAAKFDLRLRFRFPDAANPIRAFECSMSKSDGSRRFEWAVRWEHAGDGGTNVGTPPTWRLWMGAAQWVAFAFDQDLAADTWHSLELSGDISGGQVRYRRLACDGLAWSPEVACPSVPEPTRKIEVGIQLDGDSAMASQTLYVDKLALTLDRAPEPLFDAVISLPQDTTHFASADFNGDGNVDLYAGGQILMGFGSGIFYRAQDLDASGPAVAGDFDGDGILDLGAMSNTNLCIFENDGTGHFTKSSSMPLAGRPYDGWVNPIGLADFDRDGHWDIAVAVSTNLCVLQGMGDGSFMLPVYYGVLSDDVQGLVVADFDTDGYVDIVTTGFAGPWSPSGAAKGSYFRNLHDGRFASARPFAPGGYRDACAGDFDGDGLPDLGAVNYGYAYALSIQRGDGSGSFPSGQTLSGAMYPWSLGAGDFDGDGVADIVVPDSHAYVHLSSASPPFTNPRVFGSLDYAHGVTAADLNGDGTLDFVMGSRGAAGCRVFLGRGEGTFIEASGLPRIAAEGGVACADLNHDGLVDIVAVDASGVSATINGGRGLLEPLPPIGSVSNCTAVAIADLNADGHPDLLVATPSSVSVLLGDGAGRFARAGNCAHDGAGLAIGVADFNTDGTLDFAVAVGTDSASICLFRGCGGGTFEPSTVIGGLGWASYLTPDHGYTDLNRLAIADFNGDGKPDIAATTYTSGAAIFLGGGDLTFAPAGTVSTDGLPCGIVSADFNEDGKADLAVLSHTWDWLDVALGNGDGTFGATARFKTERVPIALVAGDLDGDGHQDLAVVSFYSSMVSLFRGDGRGDFSERQDHGVPNWGATCAATAELDGDGKLDLVVGGEGLTVLRQYKRAQLASAQSADPNPVAVGQEFWLRLGLTNEGPSVARNVVLQDNLPGNCELLAVEADRGTATCVGGTLTWDVGDIGSNGSGQAALRLKAARAGYGTNLLSLTEYGAEGPSCRPLVLAASLAPRITGLGRASGPANSGVLIEGTGFIGTTNVDFNGTRATFTVLSDSSIRALVPHAGSSGIVSVSNPSGSARSPSMFEVIPSVPLDLALDATNLVWSPTGDEKWFGQTGTTSDGRSAAQSGGIGHGQRSDLETTVVGPGVMTFWWRVSSESCCDRLTFSINRVVQQDIAGEVDWNRRTWLVPVGLHVLRWEYAKDASVDNGQDAGWLDQVGFMHLTESPPTIVVQPQDCVVRLSDTVTFVVEAYGYPFPSFQWRFDGSPISNATNAVLTIANMQPDRVGAYDVTISNVHGLAISQSATLALNQAPSIALIAPTNNALVTLPDRLLLGATATDSDGSVTNVSFFRGSTLLGAVAGGPFEMVWSNAVAGSSSLKAVATDNLGDKSTSAPVNVKLVWTNDNFANAVEVTGLAAQIVGSNRGATNEPGDPTWPQSLWWQWTAPADCWVTLKKLAGTSYYTCLGIYRGSTLNDLTQVASLSQHGGSDVGFMALRGTTYFLAVGSAYAGESYAGEFALNWCADLLPAVAMTSPTNNAVFVLPGNVPLSATATDGDGSVTNVAFYQGNALLGMAATGPYELPWNPTVAGTFNNLVAVAIDNLGAKATSAPVTVTLVWTNDNFANAATVTGLSAQIVGSNVGATKEPGERNHAGYSGGQSLWWKWTAPVDSRVTVTKLPDTFYHACLGVYTGAIVSNLTQVMSLSYYGGTNLSFNAQAGTTVHMAVDAAYSGSSYAGKIDLIWHANRRPQVALTSPAHNAVFDAPASIELAVEASDMDGSVVKVQFFRDASTLLATVTNAPYRWTWTNVPAQHYQMTARATDDLGATNTSATVPITVILPGDDLTNAFMLSGCHAAASASNVAASTEPGEPDYVKRSLWWHWTAPATGTVTIRTDGSSFDTKLGVYTGTVVSNLVRVAEDDDSGQGEASLVTFPATASTMFHIAAGGWSDSATGSVLLALDLNAAPTLVLPSAIVWAAPAVPFQVTVAAQDVCLPEQRVRLAVLSKPSGATFDTNTGRLTWTPPAAPTAQTNVVTVKATDGGTPALSTTNSFTIVVVPRPTIDLVGTGITPDGFRLVFTAVTGCPYRIEASTDLEHWAELGIATVSGTQGVFVDPQAAAQRQRFYRILVP